MSKSYRLPLLNMDIVKSSGNAFSIKFKNENFRLTKKESGILKLIDINYESFKNIPLSNKSYGQ